MLAEQLVELRSVQQVDCSAKCVDKRWRTRAGAVQADAAVRNLPGGRRGNAEAQVKAATALLSAGPSLAPPSPKAQLKEECS